MPVSQTRPEGRAWIGCVHFSGISRDPATAARLAVRFRGRAGAVVPMAFLVAGGEQTFYADRDYYLGTDGTVEGYVRCATAGICGNIEKDTLLRIQNPSADVESVEFLSIADYGQEEETDKALRIRFNKSVAGSGSSTKRCAVWCYLQGSFGGWCVNRRK